MPATSVAADALEACLLAPLIPDASKKGTTNVFLLANNASLEVTPSLFGSRGGSSSRRASTWMRPSHPAHESTHMCATLSSEAMLAPGMSHEGSAARFLCSHPLKAYGVRRTGSTILIALYVDLGVFDFTSLASFPLPASSHD